MDHLTTAALVAALPLGAWAILGWFVLALIMVGYAVTRGSDVGRHGGTGSGNRRSSGAPGSANRGGGEEGKQDFPSRKGTR